MCQGGMDIYPGDVTGHGACSSAEKPCLGTRSMPCGKIWLAHGCKDIWVNKRWVFIKPISLERKPELWKLRHLPEATQWAKVSRSKI